MEETKNNDLILPASILIAALLISGSVYYAFGRNGVPKENNNAGNGNVPASAEDILKVKDTDVVLGDDKAPVTMFIYGDYQCPFCSRMFTETEPGLRDEYVKTGKVKMVYRDFPLDAIHPYARAAAEAANCAGDQNKFWEYHDLLFMRQDDIPSQKFSDWAGELGMNRSEFDSCMSQGKYKSKVQADYDGGIAVGVQGTPASFINGKIIGGAQPYASFKAEIDRVLNSN